MAAAVLSAETVTLHNLPYVKDIITQRRLLEDIGATVLTPELRTHKITASHIELFEAPYELVRTMRPLFLPWDRCWRDLVKPKFLCRVVALLAPDPLIYILRHLKNLAPR